MNRHQAGSGAPETRSPVASARQTGLFRESIRTANVPRLSFAVERCCGFRGQAIRIDIDRPHILCPEAPADGPSTGPRRSLWPPRPINGFKRAPRGSRPSLSFETASCARDSSAGNLRRRASNGGDGAKMWRRTCIPLVTRFSADETSVDIASVFEDASRSRRIIQAIPTSETVGSIPYR